MSDLGSREPGTGSQTNGVVMIRMRPVSTFALAGALICVACDDGVVPRGGDADDTGSDAATDTAEREVDAGDTTSESDATSADTRSASGDTDTGPPTHPAPEIWRLQQGADEWTVFDGGDRESRFAPAEPVVAAFDIEHSNVAFILTATALHTLHLDSDRQGDASPVWVDNRPLGEVAGGGLADSDLRAAHSDPESSPDDDVAVVGLDGESPVIWRSRYDFDAGSFEAFEAEPVDWSSEEAPAVADLVAAWRDNYNAREWLDGEPPCGQSPNDEFGAYVGYLTGERVHLHDIWYCPEYFRAEALEEAGPSVEERPAVDEVGAAFWHDRELYWIGASGG